MRYAMGMVALISVETPTNTAEAKAAKHPGKAEKTFTSLFDKLEVNQAAAQ